MPSVNPIRGCSCFLCLAITHNDPPGRYTSPIEYNDSWPSESRVCIKIPENQLSDRLFFLLKGPSARNLYPNQNIGVNNSAGIAAVVNGQTRGPASVYNRVLTACVFDWCLALVESGQFRLRTSASEPSPAAGQCRACSSSGPWHICRWESQASCWALCQQPGDTHQRGSFGAEPLRTISGHHHARNGLSSLSDIHFSWNGCVNYLPRHKLKCVLTTVESVWWEGEDAIWNPCFTIMLVSCISLSDVSLVSNYVLSFSPFIVSLPAVYCSAENGLLSQDINPSKSSFVPPMPATSTFD
jgi:hypothetical protein